MDLHERFADWLAGGAEGDPPRDLAIHASGCMDCMRAVAALESVQAVDAGAASMPPSHAVGSEPLVTLGAARVAVGAAAVILLAASVGIGASGWFRPSEPIAEASGTPAGEVLGGVPASASESPTRRPSPTVRATGTPGPSPTPEATTAAATAAPIQAPPPRTAPPPPPTDEPTAAPSPTPGPTSPAPSPTSPPPTPTPDNDNPVALDDGYTAVAGAASGNVLATDSDPDDDPLTVVTWDSPSSGAFVSTDPSGTFSYLAEPGFEGTVTFTYSVGDGRGGSDVGTVTIQVSLSIP
jgi:Bacterial Ig domain